MSACSAAPASSAETTVKTVAEPAVKTVNEAAVETVGEPVVEMRKPRPGKAAQAVATFHLRRRNYEPGPPIS